MLCAAPCLAADPPPKAHQPDTIVLVQAPSDHMGAGRCHEKGFKYFQPMGGGFYLCLQSLVQADRSALDVEQYLRTRPR